MFVVMHRNLRVLGTTTYTTDPRRTRRSRKCRK